MRDSSSIIDLLLDPLAECFTPDVARRIAEMPAAPAAQARIDELADKSTEAALSTDERQEYEAILRMMCFIGLLQKKAKEKSLRSSSPA